MPHIKLSALHRPLDETHPAAPLLPAAEHQRDGQRTRGQTDRGRKQRAGDGHPGSSTFLEASSPAKLHFFPPHAGQSVLAAAWCPRGYPGWHEAEGPQWLRLLAGQHQVVSCCSTPREGEDAAGSPKLEMKPHTALDLRGGELGASILPASWGQGNGAAPGEGWGPAASVESKGAPGALPIPSLPRSKLI